PDLDSACQTNGPAVTEICQIRERNSARTGGANGLGDLNPSFFLSPAHPGKLIWGVGPTFLLPTATDPTLGQGKWGGRDVGGAEGPLKRALNLGETLTAALERSKILKGLDAVPVLSTTLFGVCSELRCGSEKWPSARSGNRFRRRSECWHQRQA